MGAGLGVAVDMGWLTKIGEWLNRSIQRCYTKLGMFHIHLGNVLPYTIGVETGTIHCQQPFRMQYKVLTKLSVKFS